MYIRVGEVVAEKYRVERIIGEGGMAFVVKARHLQLDEPVALKFLHREFLDKTDLVERFAREARAACRIKSEYVARVYDVGTQPGNVPFLVMEYLEGKNLDQIVDENGPMPVVEAVEYTMQACEALAVAHSQGIVHRDIKPDNLFLVAKRDGLGEVKVLDFGISKLSLTGSAFDPMESGLTGALALGTPLYMSPEQIRSSRSVDHRSDIWSLGVVLYELLTSTPAFNANSITEVCAAILESEPAPLGLVRADAPPGLAAVVERCLQKDPAKRYQNVAELAIALLQFAPKRARLSAERSSSVIRAAHPSVAAREELVVPSTFPPPASDQLIELGPADVDDAFDKALRAPATPSGVRPSTSGSDLANAAAANVAQAIAEAGQRASQPRLPNVAGAAVSTSQMNVPTAPSSFKAPGIPGAAKITQPELEIDPAPMSGGARSSSIEPGAASVKPEQGRGKGRVIAIVLVVLALVGGGTLLARQQVVATRVRDAAAALNGNPRTSPNPTAATATAVATSTSTSTPAPTAAATTTGTAPSASAIASTQASPAASDGAAGGRAGAARSAGHAPGKISGTRGGTHSPGSTGTQSTPPAGTTPDLGY